MIDAHPVTDITSLHSVLSLRRGSRVAIALPSLTNQESTRLQDQLNRLLSECGCSMSAGALTLSVLVCGIFDAVLWANLEVHFLKTLALNLFACVASAGLGRSAGLLRAKWKLARTIKKIEARLTGRSNYLKTADLRFSQENSPCPDA